MDECKELGSRGEFPHSCQDFCQDGLNPPGSYTCGCNSPNILLNPSDRSCFVPTEGNCGNGVVDGNEECELGTPGCKYAFPSSFLP